MIPLSNKFKLDAEIANNKVGRDHMKFAADEGRKDDLHELKMQQEMLKLAKLSQDLGHDAENQYLERLKLQHDLLNDARIKQRQADREEDHHQYDLAHKMNENQLKLHEKASQADMKNQIAAKTATGPADPETGKPGPAIEVEAREIPKVPAFRAVQPQTQGFHHGGIAEARVLKELGAYQAQHPPRAYGSGTHFVPGYEDGSPEIPSGIMNWGFNQGAFSIPQNPEAGPSDTVPAMLTPGEAVIPKEAAQDPKMKPLVHKLINYGRNKQGVDGYSEGVYFVPGYADGVDEVPMDPEAQLVMSAQNDTTPTAQAQALEDQFGGGLTVPEKGNFFTRLMDQRRQEDQQNTVPPVQAPQEGGGNALTKRIEEQYQQSQESIGKDPVDANIATENALKTGQLDTTPNKVMASGAPNVNAHIADTINIEGGYVADDAGKGPTMFGINYQANKDALNKMGIDATNMANLTKEQAMQIYNDKYFKPFEHVQALDPALYRAVTDASVNMGVGTAKKLLEQSGGDLSKFQQLRKDRYHQIVANDPSKEQYLKGWLARVDKTGVPLPGQAQLAGAGRGTGEGTEHYSAVAVPGEGVDVATVPSLPPKELPEQGVPEVLQQREAQSQEQMQVDQMDPELAQMRAQQDEAVKQAEQVTVQDLDKVDPQSMEGVDIAAETGNKEEVSNKFFDILKDGFQGLKDIMGFNDQELKRIAVMAAGSRLLGYNNRQALTHATKTVMAQSQARNQQEFQLKKLEQQEIAKEVRAEKRDIRTAARERLKEDERVVREHANKVYEKVYDEYGPEAAQAAYQKALKQSPVESAGVEGFTRRQKVVNDDKGRIVIEGNKDFGGTHQVREYQLGGPKGEKFNGVEVNGRIIPIKNLDAYLKKTGGSRRDYSADTDTDYGKGKALDAWRNNSASMIDKLRETDKIKDPNGGKTTVPVLGLSGGEITTQAAQKLHALGVDIADPIQRTAADSIIQNATRAAINDAKSRGVQVTNIEPYIEKELFVQKTGIKANDPLFKVDNGTKPMPVEKITQFASRLNDAARAKLAKDNDYKGSDPAVLNRASVAMMNEYRRRFESDPQLKKRFPDSDNQSGFARYVLADLK